MAHLDDLEFFANSPSRGFSGIYMLGPRCWERSCLVFSEGVRSKLGIKFALVGPLQQHGFHSCTSVPRNVCIHQNETVTLVFWVFKVELD